MAPYFYFYAVASDSVSRGSSRSLNGGRIVRPNVFSIALSSSYAGEATALVSMIFDSLLKMLFAPAMKQRACSDVDSFTRPADSLTIEEPLQRGEGIV